MRPGPEEPPLNFQQCAGLRPLHRVGHARTGPSTNWHCCRHPRKTRCTPKNGVNASPSARRTIGTSAGRAFSAFWPTGPGSTPASGIQRVHHGRYTVHGRAPVDALNLASRCAGPPEWRDRVESRAARRREVTVARYSDSRAPARLMARTNSLLGRHGGVIGVRYNAAVRPTAWVCTVSDATPSAAVQPIPPVTARYPAAAHPTPHGVIARKPTRTVRFDSGFSAGHRRAPASTIRCCTDSREGDDHVRRRR